MRLFAHANQHFRNNDFGKSIVHYEAAAKAIPKLKKSAQFNKSLAIKSLRKLNKIDYSPIPLNQIKGTHHENQWLSTGHDPYFLIDAIQKFRAGDWVIIQLMIKIPTAKDIIRIYVDYGKDFNEEHSIAINYHSGSLATRIFQAGEEIKRIRIDPCESEGLITIEHLAIQKINKSTALDLIKSQLIAAKKLSFKQHSHETITTIYEDLLRNEMNNDYLDWIESIETQSTPTKKEALEKIESFQTTPLISILLPTYNSNIRHLKTCIDSVLKQSYSHWELIISDDNSTNSEVKQFIKDVQKTDDRIKVILRPKNGHISAASNSALGLAVGSYVALLDHDDKLAEHALYYVACAINNEPELKLIYTDEDKIDEQDNRYNPHFKSQWNPDLLLSQNYICHLSVFKKELMDRVGGFTIGLEGSQDHDLLLKCMPFLNETNVRHVPKILYHWRAAEGSTALNSNEKNYTSSSGIKAIQNYLKNNHFTEAKVDAGLAPNTYRVIWPIPTPKPLVSLIIPTRDKQEITKLAVDSILNKTSYENYEIIIIDNGSIEEKTIAWFRDISKNPKVRVLPYNHPFNYSAINNFGVQHAKGSIIGLVNNDVEVINCAWLREMVSHAIRPEIGCVGAKLYYSNNTIQHAGVIINLGGVAGHSHKHYAKHNTGYHHRLILTQNLSAVTAACLLVRKETYIKVNGLNDRDLTVAFNDVDFCLKVRALGLRNLWTPFAELYHHESISRGAEDNPEKIMRFNREVEYMKATWKTDKIVDPYYNINLTKHREDFSLQ